MALVSRVAGSYEYDSRDKLAKEAEEELDIKIVRHDKNPPEIWKSVQKCFHPEDATEEISPQEVCYVTSRLLPDVTMSNCYGMFTVQTQPLVDPANIKRTFKERIQHVG